MFGFAYPEMFFLFFLLPPLVFFSLRSGKKGRSVAFPSLELLDGAGLEVPAWKKHGVLTLRVLVLSLIIFALARPQTGRSEHRISTEGVDIMLLLDASGSMRAQDFKPKNRLHVAKEVVKDFIRKRENDRIGLVVFAAQAVTQCPLTLDYQVLGKLIDEVHFGMLEDGTAIGVALASACNRLKHSKAKSRVVVLLTDGQNNTGSVDPVTAARVARALGIKVYTIGVGTKGVVPMPVEDKVFGTRIVPMKIPLDEETLRLIAETTEGKYFLATNREELKDIYDQVDKLEKTRIETRTFVRYSDKFLHFALPALVILLFEFLLCESILREAP